MIECRDVVMDAGTVVRALGALAQEHRLAAFRLLVQAGVDGLAAGGIAERLGVPASSMSFHLAQLGHAGLVSQRRESRSIIYAADYEAMGGLMSYLTENCCAGVACIADTECRPPIIAENKSAA
jgi:ArsR family transcriptional regulator, arsenate/arsenite/antimonite-responsive transcriptional repressor